ncbi:MAG: hypothetical protein K6G60_05760 [Lachnospiraceae bacterium]|nr:hypothetical protein [Lachnospiraceae bacterium]
MEEFNTDRLRTEENTVLPVDETTSEKNPFASALREILGSGTTLAMMTVLGIAIVLAPIAAFAGLSLSGGIISQIFSDPELQYGLRQIGFTTKDIYDIFSDVRLIIVPLTLVANIPGILTLIGYYLIWSNARKKDAPAPTTGISLLKAVCILEIIMYAFGGLMLVLSMVIFIVATMVALGYAALFLIPLYIILILIPGAAIGLGIAKDVGLMNSLEKIGSTLANTGSNKKISMFAVVLLYIAGISEAFSALTSIMVLNPGYMLVGGLSAAHLIILATLLSKIKNTLNN